MVRSCGCDGAAAAAAAVPRRLCSRASRLLVGGAPASGFHTDAAGASCRSQSSSAFVAPPVADDDEHSTPGNATSCSDALSSNAPSPMVRSAAQSLKSTASSFGQPEKARVPMPSSPCGSRMCARRGHSVNTRAPTSRRTRQPLKSTSASRGHALKAPGENRSVVGGNRIPRGPAPAKALRWNSTRGARRSLRPTMVRNAAHPRNAPKANVSTDGGSPTAVSFGHHPANSDGMTARRTHPRRSIAVSPPARSKHPAPSSVRVGGNVARSTRWHRRKTSAPTVVSDAWPRAISAGSWKYDAGSRDASAYRGTSGAASAAATRRSRGWSTTHLSAKVCISARGRYSSDSDGIKVSEKASPCKAVKPDVAPVKSTTVTAHAAGAGAETNAARLGGRASANHERASCDSAACGRSTSPRTDATTRTAVCVRPSAPRMMRVPVTRMGCGRASRAKVTTSRCSSVWYDRAKGTTETKSGSTGPTGGASTMPVQPLVRRARRRCCLSCGSKTAWARCATAASAPLVLRSNAGEARTKAQRVAAM
mmetsp:Transcript_13000/g.40372  ORF Transcript_13000/g.40372 Transcript_13000/m.40372 type:complete len:537 (-) Transcript_13000:538-2148(-)